MRNIKVMSLNMKRDYLQRTKSSFGRRRYAIEAVIKKYAPDVIGTQEMTYEMVEEMQRLLGHQYAVVGCGRNGGTKGEYNAIFYNKEMFVLKEDDTFWLSRTPARPSRSWLASFPRICTTCELVFKADANRAVRIYNTHLDHVSYLARLRGLQLITRLLKKDIETSPLPTIIMGDFNAKPDSFTIKQWQKYQKRARVKLYNVYNTLKNSSVGRSYHGYGGKTDGQPIDYIFVTNDLKVEDVTICHDQKNNVYPSDHYPVFASFYVAT